MGLGCRLSAGGLSPRVRGNPIDIPVLGLRFRSIPACAGEPHPSSQGIQKRWVYPRVCGGTTLRCCAGGG